MFYRIPYCVPAWGWREHWAILKCVITGSIINGRSRERLYSEIMKKTGLKHVFGFNSGQDAIYAALKARGVKRGDRVIMPSYCCETVARAVLDSGADIYFCDIGADLNPDIDHILSILDPDVKAIIFTHLFGNPGSIDELEKRLEEIGRRSDILVIDDAAQSFGAILNGKLLGTFGDAGIISFGPGKTMTASGGGLLVTDSDRLAQAVMDLPMSRVTVLEKLRRLVYWVIFRRWRRFTLPLLPLFNRLQAGINRTKSDVAMLTNVDAAIATEQLGKLDRFIGTRIYRRNLLDRMIDEHSEDLSTVKMKKNKEGRSVSVATKYLVCVKGNPGDILDRYSKTLADLKIEIQQLYMPIHLKPEYSFYSEPLPETEKVYERLIQIPLEPSISDRDFNYIVDGFSFLRHA
jgi:dTDP-4-amino-4,6-dideoxygalactose transaminase